MTGENRAKWNNQFAQIMAGNFLIDFRGWYHQFVVGWNVFDYLVVHVKPQGILDLSDVLAGTITMELD